MVINETMARGFWPDQDALGQMVRLGSPTNAPVEIVGVVRDTRLNIIQEKPAPYLYLPLAQHQSWQCFLLVESVRDAAALAGPVRSELGALGRKPTRAEISTISAFVRAKLSDEEFVAQTAAALDYSAWIGFGGAVRCPGLCGQPAHAGDRHPDGLGSPTV